MQLSFRDLRTAKPCHPQKALPPPEPYSENRRAGRTRRAEGIEPILKLTQEGRRTRKLS